MFTSQKNIPAQYLEHNKTSWVLPKKIKANADFFQFGFAFIGNGDCIVLNMETCLEKEENPDLKVSLH